MRLLVLGGTAFVGRHIVEAAVERGHEVTLFNRGHTNPDLFAGIPTLRGDRDASELDALRDGDWDAVIDVNGYMPRQVREMVALLVGRVGTYCFISTGSVYAERGAVDTDETSPVAELDGPVGDTWTDQTYGPLKALCEREVLDGFPESAVLIRPGIVAGPHDASERFTYWVRRLTRGGKVLGPQRPEQPLQLVHARDQAEFIVDVLGSSTAGVFNTVGPDEPMTFADMIGACAAAAGTEADVVWAPDAFLREQKVLLPLGMPASGRWDGAFRRSNQRAKEYGFRNRSIAQTAADTLAWDRTRDQGTTMSRALTATREAELIALL